MIVTLTPNPSVDRAYDLAALARGGVNRADVVHVDAGGKGINVSRALAAHGVPTVAVVPVGGADGDLLVALLGPTGVTVRTVPVPGGTRSNVTLQEADGTTTKVNAPGPELDADAETRLVAAVVDGLGPGDTVVGAGSLPRGLAPDLYATLAGAVRARGARLVLDTSGAPLVAAARAGGLALAKPNEDELAELVGRALPTVGDVVAAAREILARGTDALLVSLGAHGALLVTPDASWWAGGPPLVPASTVGAGDTTLAGYLAAEHAGADPATCLRTAVAWGRAAVLLPGTAVPGPDLVDLDAVTLVPDPAPTTLVKEL